MEAKAKKAKKMIFFIELIVFLLIIVSFASAAKIYEGWIYSGQKISANNQEFQITFSEGLKDIILKTENDVIVVNYFECAKKENLDICFTQKTYDYDMQKNKAYITISQNLPNLLITRNIQKTTLYQGEKTNISILIKNSGDFAAEDIYFEDDLSGFEVSNVVGCQKEGNIVKYSGRLRVNETKKCTYYITAIDTLEKTSKAKLQYYDTQKRTKYSLGANFIVRPLISSTLEVNKDVPVGNITKVRLTMRAQNITFSLNGIVFQIGKGLSFDSSSGANLKKISDEFDGETYWWNYTIKNETNITFYVQAQKIGYAQISAKIRYLIGEKEYQSEEKKTISIKSEEMVFSTSLNDNSKFDAASTAWIKVFAENKNKFSSMKNILLKIDSPLFEEKIYGPFEVNLSEKKMLLYLKRTFPSINITQTYDFNVNATYETEFGDVYSKKIQNTIEINPPKELEIAKTFSNENPESESEVIVTTKVTNGRNKKIQQVSLYDTSPIGKLSGVTSGNFEINASKTVVANSYKITLPYVGSDTRFNITTHIVYTDDLGEHSQTKNTELTIKKKELKIDFARTIPDVMAGNFFTAQNTITNNEKEELKNIRILPSPQQEFGLLDDMYSIKKLSPGEKIKFDLVYLAKENKSATLKGERLTFEDEHGTIYEQNFSDVTINVLPSRTNSPKIYLNKFVKNISSNVAVITINLTNKGQDTLVSTIENGKKYDLLLRQNIPSKIEYNKSFEFGKHELVETKVNYNFMTKNISIFSNKVYFELVVPKKEPDIAVETAANKDEKPKEIKTNQTKISAVEVKKPIESAQSIGAANGGEDKKESAFSGLFSIFTSIFNILRGK